MVKNCAIYKKIKFQAENPLGWLKMQDWKMTDKMSEAENAGQENDGQTL